jgi:phage shock protein C
LNPERKNKAEEEMMRLRGRKFALDRENAKFLGVCSGLAEATGIDATIIRVALIVGTLAGGWPWTVIAYFVLAWFGGARPRRAAQRHDLSDLSSASWEAKERIRRLDQRMAAIEAYSAGTNSKLAEEIERLR